MDPALAITGLLGCLALAWGVWQRLKLGEAEAMIEDRARIIGRLKAEIVQYQQAEGARDEAMLATPTPIPAPAPKKTVRKPAKAAAK
jgi:hypothetical protein